MKDYEAAVDCEHCDLAAVRVFTPLALAKVAPDLRYTSPVDGTPVTTWAARADDLKRHGCIPYDPEMKKDAARTKREREASFEAKVDTTVREAMARLPEKKKRQLKHEIVNQHVGLEVKRSAGTPEC